MLNRRLASALTAWWGAVLDRRAVLEAVGAVIARLRCRGLLRALHSLRANVEHQGKKRAADAHYLHTKVQPGRLAPISPSPTAAYPALTYRGSLIDLSIPSATPQGRL